MVAGADVLRLSVERPVIMSLRLHIGGQVGIRVRGTALQVWVPVAAIGHGAPDILVRIPDLAPFADQKYIVDEPAPAGGGETLRPHCHQICMSHVRPEVSLVPDM
jgi:hypothetical protein